MKKVIVKCRLKSRDGFEQKLSEVGLDFGPLYWLNDRIYTPRSYVPGSNYPRLIMRTEMKALDRPAQYKLILKRHIEDSGVDIVNETVIKDYTEIVNIIYQLGFEKRAEISRRRQELTMEEGTKLYLDNIDGVSGFFAKFETKLDEKDKISDVRLQLTKTLEAFGEKNIVNDTYADMSR